MYFSAFYNVYNVVAIICVVYCYNKCFNLIFVIYSTIDRHTESNKIMV